MNNSLVSLSIPQLKRALALKERIARLNKKLDAILGASSAAPAAAAAASGRPGKPGRPAKKKRNNMSAAGRAAISSAAKARWARVKAEKNG